MPDAKITALTAISVIDPAVDPLPIVDVSDTAMAASGTTKKITINQILGASGTATLASATITGNLTVDTNTLFVDSANDRVGVGLAAGINAKLHVSSTGSVHINQRTGNNGCFTQYIDPTSSNYVGTDSGNFRVANNSGQDLLNIQQLGVFTFGDGAGGTRMTLNATGLGVGGSPTRKLSIVGSGATYANINSGDNTSLVGILLGGTSTPSAGQVIYDNTANSLAFFTSGASRLLIDSSGNLGIGVTPSYLLHTAVASGANRNIARFQVTGASNGLTITWNHATTKMIVNFSNLPTSSAGLASGDLWIDTAAGNTLKVA